MPTSPDQSTNSSIPLSTVSLDQSTDPRIPADQSKNFLIPQTSQRMLQYLRRIAISQPTRLITGHADTSKPINRVTGNPRSVNGAFSSDELRSLDQSIDFSAPWVTGVSPLDDGHQQWTSDPSHGSLSHLSAADFLSSIGFESPPLISSPNSGLRVPAIDFKPQRRIPKYQEKLSNPSKSFRASTRHSGSQQKIPGPRSEFPITTIDFAPQQWIPCPKNRSRTSATDFASQ